MDDLDPIACYRAIQTRDARFDGLLYVGVRSTGIYCRPVCPARTPHAAQCRFFAHAAAAQAAGFRPCLRCRPETAPEFALWRGTANTVSRALALIAEGALDGQGASVERLAARLGLGGRQLRRLFQTHLGATPVAVAQTRRVLFAKSLIHQTRLPMTEIALAAGFGSVRRFNETFQHLFRRPPAALRRDDASLAAGSPVTLTLRYRPPYDWPAMLGFLATRAIPGIERVEGEVYHRAVEQDGQRGTVSIAHAPARSSLTATIRMPGMGALQAIVARIRRVFDLGAQVDVIGGHLARDRWLAALVARRPGLRAPGGWDGFELALRAVLGQQVTLAAARALAHRLFVACDAALPAGPCPTTGLTHAFPTADAVARADLATLGMPGARRETLRAIARAASADPQMFAPARGLADAIDRLRAIPGVGEWTAQYIALRALRETDAFPDTDVGLLRAAADADGIRPTPRALLARAEAWRPWRAYAAQHLWAADADALLAARKTEHA
jgi:AraC family transcriptional regulator of adaptative response / DNA-3-methyladenine glycosylase II